MIGFLCKSIEKYSDCELCLKAIKYNAKFSNHPSAHFANLKAQQTSTGIIVHPHAEFFSMIWDVETTFHKYQKSPNVYSLTAEAVSKMPLKFPCSVHATDIVSFAITYYLKMRINQYISQENSNVVKTSAHIAKTARIMQQ